MFQKPAKKKTYIAADPSMRGKTLYILYKFDIYKEELISDGPFMKKDEAYNKMNLLLKKGVCSWVVVYNG
jgi:GTP-dependent phosphoenolpyruvate carboxykinase